MADTNPDTQEASGGASEERLFTQADVNQAVQDRLARADKAHEKALQAAVEKAVSDERERVRIASLEGEERMKADFDSRIRKSEEETAALRAELTESKRANQILRAQGELLSKNLPASFAETVIGATDEETSAKIAALSKAFNDAVEAKVGESLHRGTPPTGGQQVSERDAVEAELDRVMRV